MDSTYKEGSGSVKVLLVPPLLERNYDIFFKHFKPEFKKVFTFFMIKPIPRHENGTVNYCVLLEQCRKVIGNEDIGIVFANKQAGAFVAAVLFEEFKHIRGPSIESVFLCNHEYYKTHIIDSRKIKIPYSIHSIGEDKYDFAYHIINNVKMPGLLRPCLGVGHSTYDFRNRDQLVSLFNQCKQDTEHIVGMHQYLIENFVDLKKYPMAISKAVLMNTILEPYGCCIGSSYTKVHIEACVFQKEIIPWSICDVETFSSTEGKENNVVFAGVKMPSGLPNHLLDIVWAEYKKDLQNVVDTGFDYSFMHAEYNVYKDGFIHLVTMCVGPNANNTKMYSLALDHGNNMEAALQVCMGIRPKTPKVILNNQVVLNHIMLVFESCKADSLIRFVNAKTNPAVWLRYLSGQDIIIEPAKRHAIVGIIATKGTDPKECLEKIKALRADNLKLPDLVPLTCQKMSL